MTGPSSAMDLVNRHCRYSTRDLAKVQARLRDMRNGVSLSVTRPDGFVSYHEAVLKIGAMTLTIGCIDSQTGYDLSFRTGEEYVVTIPLRGRGWASTGSMFVEYARNDVMIVRPMCRVEKHWDGPGEVLSIHIPAEHFDAAVAAADGRKSPSAPIMRVDGRLMRTFVRFIDMLCGDLQDGSVASPFLNSSLGEQTEKMLLALLLEGLGGETMDRSAPKSLSPAIPYYVRRADQFISGNVHRPICIEDIAEAAGVSARTIQYGFRKFFETTPMMRVKQVRYKRARALLLADGSDKKISDIAGEIGCQNISQFSRDYRSFFGETPSATIAAPRCLVS